MKSRKKTKILYKFLLFILPFLVLSIVVTSTILTWTSYSHFQKTVSQDYENIINSSAGEIRLYMENAKKNLDSLAWVIAATKLDAWQKAMALTAFNHKMSEFLAVSLIAVNGDTVATTRWEEQQFASSHNALFKKVLSKETAISGVMITGENLPFVYIVVPVRRLGEVAEILWGELNLKSVWDVLEGITIGRTGQVYIMDLSGRYIAHKKIDRVVKAPPIEKPEILKAVKASDRPVKWSEQKEGVKFFCLGSYVPDLDWIVVLQQPMPEIYTYLYRNIYFAICLTVVICLIALLFGWSYVKRFLSPIHSLHQQVQRISRGNLEQKVSVNTTDEIGELSMAFNEMTDSLKDYIQREIETAKDLVHAKNLAVLGTTSSKVTHEVGNLLSNVGMILSMLKHETLSPKGEKALGVLEKESTRVKEFILHFLQFAKKPELRLSETAIDFVVKDVLAANQIDAERRNIEFEIYFPSNLPKVNADARLLYQAINNLVKNSMEALPESGVIRINGKLDAKHFYMEIEDTGSGIDPDVLEHIFDPFFTTKGKKGTGLGMSIVKTIIEAHRGTVECQSEVEKGTKIILRLPLRK